MNLTEAARQYRTSEDRQEAIEEIYLTIGDEEHELKTRRKKLLKEKENLDSSIPSTLDHVTLREMGRRKASLMIRIAEIDARMTQLDSQYETLKVEFESYNRLQRDLEGVFGEKDLFREYDRLFHGK